MAVSAGHEYMGGTRGSRIVASADDVLELSITTLILSKVLVLVRLSHSCHP